MESHTVGALGPKDEALTVDVASLVSDDDEHLIILTSGVHGVEGFVGACIQFETLEMLARSDKADGIGYVLIHAANPWGFAHLRRVDNNNVDVNRNFFDPPSKPPKSHPDYPKLNPVINPEKSPDTLGELSYWLNAIKLIIKNRGVKNLFKPIAEGQYDFPQGVFFGGKQVTESCKLLQDLVCRYSLNFDRVSVLDIHSGLGPSGTVTLIGNTNFIAPEKRLNRIRSHFGRPVYIDTDETNTYNAQGTFSRWCQQALSDKQILFLCIEIGTVNPIKLFSALRRENQAHHWSAIGSSTYIGTKETLRTVFAPQSLHWRQRSVEQGLSVLLKTMEL